MEESDDDDVSMGDVSMGGSDEEANDCHEHNSQAEQGTVSREVATATNEQFPLQTVVFTDDSQNNANQYEQGSGSAVREVTTTENDQLTLEAGVISEDSQETSNHIEHVIGSVANEQLAHQTNVSTGLLDRCSSLEQDPPGISQDAALIDRESALASREKCVAKNSEATQELLKELEDLQVKLEAREKKLEEWEADLIRREQALQQVMPKEACAPAYANKSKDDVRRTCLDTGFVEVPLPLASLPAVETPSRGEQTRDLAAAGPRSVEEASSTRSKLGRFWFTEGDTVQILEGPYRGMKASIRRFFGPHKMNCCIEANGDVVLLGRGQVKLMEACSAPRVSLSDTPILGRNMRQKPKENKVQRQSFATSQAKASSSASHPAQASSDRSKGRKRPADSIASPSIATQIIAKSPEATSSVAEVSRSAQSILSSQKRLNRSVQSGSGFAMFCGAMRKFSKHAAPDDFSTAGTYSRNVNAMDALLPGRKVEKRQVRVETTAEMAMVTNTKKQRNRDFKSDKAKRLMKDIDGGVQRRSDL